MRRKREGNVLLLDQRKGFGLSYRDQEQYELAEPLKYGGAFVHLCVPGEENQVIEIKPPKDMVSPEEVYRARYWPEVRLIFGMRATWREKIDRGLWLGALGILAFLTFMLVASLL